MINEHASISHIVASRWNNRDAMGPYYNYVSIADARPQLKYTHYIISPDTSLVF